MKMKCKNQRKLDFLFFEDHITRFCQNKIYLYQINFIKEKKKEIFY